MRSPRKVTLQPMAWFSRNLKLAMESRDLVTLGFWPAMRVMSATAPSSSDGC